ncbi:MAG: cation diffusion facilitator family transporter [Candidatus Bruticola sp.]
MSQKYQPDSPLNSDSSTNNANDLNLSASETYLTVGSKAAEQIALKVSNWSILCNFILTAAKFIAGIVAHSSAMISDAVHTASDVLSTLVVIVSIKIAGKKSDSDHQYGHERFESLGSLILALMLLATGLMIGWGGLNKLWSHNGDLEIPGTLALYAAVLSIVVKEAMYWYTIAAAKKIGSAALKADAWHHRSDALSSLGALIGIAAAQLGFPAGDPIASLLICLCIIQTAWDIGKDSAEKLTDQSCDEQTVKALTNTAARQEGVLAVQELKTRLFGTRVYIDITIMCERSLTLQKAHDIAESVHNAIEQDFPQVKHCNVHVNPN